MDGSTTTTSPPPPTQVLLTGATGYVGGRLLSALEKRGVALRCLARNTSHLRSRVRPETEVVAGDVLAPDTLVTALADIHTAYYLVHSMAGRDDFEDRDRRAAKSFAEACRRAGVERIIYVGGLGRSEERLSTHLRSRHEVGAILGSSGVTTVELRASIVIGSGSLSFEMVRSLVERLPVMLTPRWVRVLAQPIAIDDLVEYLVASLDVPVEGHRIFEIGGDDRVSYGDLMREYARQRGLRRIMIPVPLLTPGLSKLWLGLVTPLYARVGKHLISSIRHRTVVTDRAARDVFDIHPRGVREAIATAMRNEDHEIAQTRWNDVASVAEPFSETESLGGGLRLVDQRQISVSEDPSRAFAPIRRIGGERGWYFANLLWQLRSVLDVIFGGPGLRRGRRHPEILREGDVVDFWRVEEYERDRFLRLRAEMRLPGRAWLQFEVSPGHSGAKTIISQTAIFDPSGVLGRLYWYAIYPIHVLVFRGMLLGIGRQARRPEKAPPEPVGRLLPLVLLLLLCLGVSGIGGWITSTSVSGWYPTLSKPSWTPPSWVFGPVWTVLYVMMSIAAWRVWTRRSAANRLALALFGAQLVLNLGWSIVFFGWQAPGWAVVEMGALWLAVVATVASFWRLDRAAALLLLPYLAWISFAAALNVAFWRLNA